jgi:DtxR family transcriptional regulator, Mn-dependent transcriptional regulator
MIRNTRLLEEIDEKMVSGIEHHMEKKFTDALCTLLKHSRKCPQ